MTTKHKHNMNYTSIEQSKLLLDSGLDPETADMFYNGIADINTGVYSIPEDGHTIRVGKGYEGKCPTEYFGSLFYPAWSLSALWDLMPTIKTEHGIMRPKSVKESTNVFKYRFYYETLFYTDMHKSGTDAAVEMICWLLDNRYIETSEKKEE